MSVFDDFRACSVVADTAWEKLTVEVFAKP